MTNRVPEKTLYMILLLAYPSDFRVRFGAEMVDVFSEEMCLQRKLRGFSGVFRGWCSAFWEVISVAGPLRLRDSIAIPLFLSIAASSAFALAFFVAVSPHCTK
jgi:hypothetical protein